MNQNKNTDEKFKYLDKMWRTNLSIYKDLIVECENMKNKKDNISDTRYMKTIYMFPYVFILEFLNEERGMSSVVVSWCHSWCWEWSRVYQF